MNIAPLSRNLREPFENGDIEPDSGAVTNCLNCDWYGVSVRFDPDGGEDMQSCFVCPECGESGFLDEPEKETLEVLQSFGYSYTEKPQNIPKGKEEDFRL